MRTGVAGEWSAGFVLMAGDTDACWLLFRRILQPKSPGLGHRVSGNEDPPPPDDERTQSCERFPVLIKLGVWVGIQFCMGQTFSSQTWEFLIFTFLSFFIPPPHTHTPPPHLLPHPSNPILRINRRVIWTIRNFINWRIVLYLPWCDHRVWLGVNYHVSNISHSLDQSLTTVFDFRTCSRKIIDIFFVWKKKTLTLAYSRTPLKRDLSNFAGL